mmetsp:Transcript_15152/g.24623  ORF Transcript_15152/g.24623 Transcript_15152/m.24623 type:complete len:279 (+) Transcript_15152:56-892(+)
MTTISSLECAYIQGLSGYRGDGRGNRECRQLSVDVGRNKLTGQARCQVSLGDTVALAVVNATAVEPFSDRPNEGILKVNAILSSMAREDLETSKTSKSKASSKFSAILEQCVLGSRAIDLEGLCIIAGKLVWSVRVDVMILNDSGNVYDCGCLAAFGALSYYRRPDVSVVGTSYKIFSLEEREPVPLSIHHIPLCVTFSLFKKDEGPQGETLNFFLMDPDDREELAEDGKITIIVNSHKEICGVHKQGWPPLSSEELSELVRLACERAPTLEKKIVMQ